MKKTLFLSLLLLTSKVLFAQDAETILQQYLKKQHPFKPRATKWKELILLHQAILVLYLVNVLSKEMLKSSRLVIVLNLQLIIFKPITFSMKKTF